MHRGGGLEGGSESRSKHTEALVLVLSVGTLVVLRHHGRFRSFVRLRILLSCLADVSGGAVNRVQSLQTLVLRG